MEMELNKNYWISWYSPHGKSFELHLPWWISGYTWDREDNQIDIICAAVKAKDEEEAIKIAINSYDEKKIELEFRFCSERGKDWSPFGDRFRKSKWMKWENESEN